MSKKEQVLVIEPPIELTFTGPFTQVPDLTLVILVTILTTPQAVSSYMKLKNPSDKKVCFKIPNCIP